MAIALPACHMEVSLLHHRLWPVLIATGNERNPETGTFAEYILIRGDISLKIPPNISFEEAATLGCALATVSLGFYRYLEMPFLSFPPEPKPDGPPILIYGGSSATGTIAIQFAKLYVPFYVNEPEPSMLIIHRSGFTVITVASPRNFELCKRVGADHVFDYVCSPGPLTHHPLLTDPA